MASPMDDRGVDAFLELLQEGSKGPGPKWRRLSHSIVNAAAVRVSTAASTRQNTQSFSDNLPVGNASPLRSTGNTQRMAAHSPVCPAAD